MDGQSPCPCEGLDRPAPTSPADRSSVGYRQSGFGDVRRRLLLPLGNEQGALADWRASATTDLGLQVVDWWAYLAEILDFYNERAANESYLEPARRPESMRRLVRLLGYRPRPGIGARGVLAAEVAGDRGITLPLGFAVDSKPGPQEEPQTFELDADTEILPGGVLRARPAEYVFSPNPAFFFVGNADPGLHRGDWLLLSHSDGTQPLAIRVTEVSVDSAAKRTRVSISPSAFGYAALSAGSLRIRKPTQTARLLTLPAAPSISFASRSRPIVLAAIEADSPTVISTGGHLVGDIVSSGLNVTQIGAGPRALPAANISGSIALASVVRDIQPGESIIILQVPNDAYAHTVAGSHDQVTMVATGGSDPPSIPILHTILDVTPPPGSLNAGTVTVLYGWRDVIPLLNQPAQPFTPTAADPTVLYADNGAIFPEGPSVPLLLRDAAGLGAVARGATESDHRVSRISAAQADPPQLTPPVDVYTNLLSVSRGKTVTREVLGSGDAHRAGQEFVLKKSPLTYFAQGDGVRSTLEISVDGRLWTEVASFYEQPPSASVYVTREDEKQRTHVLFGDGENGARLPSGRENVVARYRYGSGAQSPATGTLTVIAKPYPNLKAVRNPVAVSGGADPDLADHLRRLAPRSVLTFRRAVSIADHEAIAGVAPGVRRVKARWQWSPQQQRALVRLTVGDDRAAAYAAHEALSQTADPNKPFEIVVAVRVPIEVSLELRYDPTFVREDVQQAVCQAFFDQESGLFGRGRPDIGRALYHSELVEAALRPAGAVSVRALRVAGSRPDGVSIVDGSRYVPGPDAFFELAKDDLSLTLVEDRRGRGR